jgi:hypothetical protein
MKMQGSLDTEAGALILTVDSEGLGELVELLRGAKPTQVKLTPPGGRQTTWPLSILKLEHTTENTVSIASHGVLATISGSPAAISRLAREVYRVGEYNDLLEPGMHAHFNPSNQPFAQPLLSPHSESLIIAGPVPN